MYPFLDSFISNRDDINDPEVTDIHHFARYGCVMNSKHMIHWIEETKERKTKREKLRKEKRKRQPMNVD